MPCAFHRQCALDDIAVQQADPGDKAVLAQDIVAPSPTELQAERHGSAAPGTPPSSPGTGTPEMALVVLCWGSHSKVRKKVSMPTSLSAGQLWRKQRV